MAGACHAGELRIGLHCYHAVEARMLCVCVGKEGARSLNTSVCLCVFMPCVCVCVCMCLLWLGVCPAGVVPEHVTSFERVEVSASTNIVVVCACLVDQQNIVAAPKTLPNTVHGWLVG